MKRWNDKESVWCLSQKDKCISSSLDSIGLYISPVIAISIFIEQNNHFFVFINISYSQGWHWKFSFNMSGFPSRSLNLNNNLSSFKTCFDKVPIMDWIVVPPNSYVNLHTQCSYHQGEAFKKVCARLPLWLRWWKKKNCLQCRRPRFNPWVGKIPWRRAWQPTPVFLPGEPPWRLAGWQLACTHHVLGILLWLY